MNAKKRGVEGFYPNLSLRDIVRDGHVTIFRNVAGRSFADEDAIRIDVGWNNFDELPAAIKKARAKEKTRAKETPMAWDPEFGYLSADPSFSGNNFFIGCLMHLEALNLLGDLKYVLNALRAVRIEAWGFQADNIHDSAHLYRLENRYSLGISEETLATRVSSVYYDLAQQELNARLHLVEEDSRVLADAVARALAVLRYARLLSPWELTDILSPIRMVASMGFIDGITKEEIDDFTLKQFGEPPDNPESREQERARDRRDADFADRMNRRFAKVRLNALGKELLES